jgi:predicted PurR-regulated permease PerM
MSNLKNNLLGTALTAAILFATVFISHRYIRSIAWAVVIAIASWPAYRLWRQHICRNRNTLAAAGLTLIVALIIIIPLSWFAVIMAKELILASQYLAHYNKTGIHAPTWLNQIPIIGIKLQHYWQQHLTKPAFLENISTQLQHHYQNIGSFLSAAGSKTIYNSVSFFFTLFILFFLYRDGDSIAETINHAGKKLLADRWQHYFDRLPKAIGGVVNGTLVSAILVGFVMGVAFTFTGLPLPALFGLLAAVGSLIPFGLFIILILAVGILIAQKSYIAAIVILILGAIISTLSDNVIKPAIIGSNTEMPFALILIGVLGGLENLGLLGLFLGPIIMLLLYNLYQEAAAL